MLDTSRDKQGYRASHGHHVASMKKTHGMIDNDSSSSSSSAFETKGKKRAFDSRKVSILSLLVICFLFALTFFYCYDIL